MGRSRRSRCVQVELTLCVRSRFITTVSCVLPTISFCVRVTSRKPSGTSTKDLVVCEHLFALSADYVVDVVSVVVVGVVVVVAQRLFDT